MRPPLAEVFGFIIIHGELKGFIWSPLVEVLGCPRRARRSRVATPRVDLGFYLYSRIARRTHVAAPCGGLGFSHEDSSGITWF